MRYQHSVHTLHHGDEVTVATPRGHRHAVVLTTSSEQVRVAYLDLDLGCAWVDPKTTPIYDYR